MAEVTGSIGNEAVELNNAATEATLRLLLQSSLTANKQTVDEIKRLASRSFNIDPASLQNFNTNLNNASNSSGLLTNSLGVAGKAIGGLGFATGLVSGLFNGVGVGLTKLTGQLTEGTARTSDLIGVFSQMPGVAGMFFRSLQRLYQFQEASFDSYQKLSNAGVNFGGSLTDLRLAASKSYLTLIEFSDMMITNRESLARMGGTVDQGARNFAKLSNALISSNTGDMLLSLGYSTKQVNEGMLTYISATGGRTQKEMQNARVQEQLIASSANYMLQLDTLAEITGKSRDQQEEELKEARQNQAWQAYLLTLDENSRANANALLTETMARSGKSAAQAMMSAAMGFPPMTKQAQQWTGMFGEAANQQMQVVRRIKDSNADVEDMQNGAIKTQFAMGQAAKNNLQVYSAILMQGGESAQMLGDAIGIANQFTQQGILTEKDALEQRKTVEQMALERRKSEAAEVAKSEKAMKELGQEIMGALTPIIRALTPVISSVVQMFSNFVKNLDLPAISQQFAVFATQLAEYMQNIFTEEGRAKIINDIKYAFGLLVIELKKAFIPWYSDAAAARDTKALELDRKIKDAEAEAANLKIESAQRSRILQLNGDKAAQEALAEQIKTETAKINELVKRKNSQKDLSDAEKKEIESDIKKSEGIVRTNKNLLEQFDVKTGKLTEDTRKKLEEKQKREKELPAEIESAISAKKEFEDKPKRRNPAGGLVDATQLSPFTAINESDAETARLARQSTLEPANQSDAESQRLSRIPKLAEGGIITNPTLAMLSEKTSPEAVVPLESEKLETFLTPVFEKLQKQSAISSLGGGLNLSPEVAKSLGESMKNLPPMTGLGRDEPTNLISKLSSFITDLPKTISEKADSVSKTTTAFVDTPTNTAKSMENLQTELRTLNNQTAEMLKYLRETADYSRRNIDAIKSLNGDLFRM